MIDDMIARIEAASTHVPLGNSEFQALVLGTAGHEHPAWRMKALCNAARGRVEALKECRWRRRRVEIDIAEIEEKLVGSLDKWERARLEVDLDEKRSRLADELKLIEDSIAELAAYDREIAALPPVESREAFEAAMPIYWARRLWGDAQREILATGRPGVGTIKALTDMGLVPQDTPQGWRLTGPSNVIGALTDGR